MRITKKLIEKTIKEDTGLDIQIEKFELEYYWCGKIASLFSETSTHYTKLNHPNVSLSDFVSNFKNKVKEVEKEHEKDIMTVVNSIDWKVEFAE